MNKKLYLMSEMSLLSYTSASRDLQGMAVGMAAADIKDNTAFVLASAQINQIPENGRVVLDIDRDGNAHIPITGMLTNTVTPSAAFEGKSITTYNFITESAALVESDSSVKGVILDINTGGGDVDGAETAALAIAGITKHVTARIFGSAQSSGILIASQANRIVAIGKMSMLGSVGVAGEFKDRTEADAKAGIKNVILTSTDAPEKRLSITTDEGQAKVIELMDEVHSAMVGHIARGRNLDPEFVNKNFGRGGTMAAERALAVGMIDEIEGVPAKSKTQSTTKSFTASKSQPQTGEPETLKNEKKMDTLAEFLASNPQAKVDHDAMILAAEQKGSDTKQAELKTYSAKVSPIVASGSYTKRITAAGLEVLSGERSLQSFDDMVAVFDENTEALKAEKIKETQPPATPGGGGDLTAEQQAKAETTANVEAMKSQLGNSKEVL